MKILLRIFVLGLFIVIQSQSNICAMKRQKSPEIFVDRDGTTYIFGSEPGDLDFISAPTVSGDLYYVCFTNTENKKRIKIETRTLVPYYNADEEGIVGNHFAVIIGTIGEWELDDPYVQETFEFIDDHQCRFRQQR